jgi:hypothetical protein
VNGSADGQALIEAADVNAASRGRNDLDDGAYGLG